MPGVLVPTGIKIKGLGGGLEVKFSCTDCTFRNVTFRSSLFVEQSRRTTVSLALCVAFIISGQMYGDYFKLLNKSLGVKTITKNNFFSVVKDMYPVVKTLLDDATNEARDYTKEKDPSTLGSWKKLVTTADGCWLTRGFHSQNATYVIKDYVENTILWYGHLCMKGSDDLLTEPLWPGTSKGAEGELAQRQFR